MFALYFLSILLAFESISANEQYNDEESRKLFNYVDNTISRYQILSKEAIEEYQSKGADINKFFTTYDIFSEESDSYRSFNVYHDNCLHRATRRINAFNTYWDRFRILGYNLNDGDKIKRVESTIDTLIACGSNIHAQDGRKRSALQIAIFNKERRYDDYEVEPNPYLVKILLKHKANPNEIYDTKVWNQPLNMQVLLFKKNNISTSIACIYKYVNAHENKLPSTKLLQIIDALFDNNVDINTQDTYGNTLLGHTLHVTRKMNTYIPDSLIRILMSKGSNPFILNKDNISLAILAQKTAPSCISSAVYAWRMRGGESCSRMIANKIMLSWLEKHRDNYERFRAFKENMHDKYIRNNQTPHLQEAELRINFDNLNLPWRYEDQINPDNFDIEQYKQEYEWSYYYY